MKNTVLRAEFGEAQRAACYLASGLSKAFPHTAAHITVFSGTAAGPRVFTTDTNHLEPMLERIARRFPSHELEVLYDPAKQNGVVGVLRCSCGHLHTMCCPLCCKSNADKPQAVIRIIESADDGAGLKKLGKECSCDATATT